MTPELLLQNAIRDHIFPGCVLTIHDSKGKAPFWVASSGKFTYAPWSHPVNTETIFDLASLTKPICSALSIMALISRGLIQLDTAVSDIIKNNRSGTVTIRHLLSHTSGLPAWKPFWRPLSATNDNLRQRKKMLLDLILKESMGKESGSFEKAVYSDLGFMLLGIIIEKVMNTDLNEAAKNLVFDPLCVEDIFFIPEKGHLTSTFSRQKLIKNTAPTLYCPYRKRIIMGEVHDLNAWAMGGLAGHSGLFGTGKAVCKLLKKFLLIFKGRFEHPVFKRDLMREFFIKQEMDPASTWALGFDTPSPEGSSSGDHFSPESVGHLGYTGTSFWMDPREEMIVVFLSNRTFPHDTEKSRLAIKDLRRKLHNLIMEKRNLTCC